MSLCANVYFSCQNRQSVPCSNAILSRKTDVTKLHPVMFFLLGLFKVIKTDYTFTTDPVVLPEEDLDQDLVVRLEIMV